MSKVTETISLESIGSGAAVERFKLALNDVLDNILDPNTDAKKARSITLKITMKPDENREFSKAEISVATALAPITPVKTQFFIGRDNTGHGVATEYNPQQTQISISERPPAPTNVLTMKTEAQQ